MTPQRLHEAPASLPRDPSPGGLYAGALRHVAGRAAVSLASVALRLARWATSDTRATARDRAVEARHPSTRPRLAVVPDGYAQGRADLQFTHAAGCCPHTPGGPHSVLCQRKDTP